MRCRRMLTKPLISEDREAEREVFQRFFDSEYARLVSTALLSVRHDL